MDFGNPDFVKYAESFGVRGYSIGSAAELIPVLEDAFQSGEPAVIDCPVDYSENMKLSRHLAQIYQDLSKELEKKETL